RGENETDDINLIGCIEENQGRNYYEDNGLRNFYSPLRQLPCPCAWIERVELPVNETVETHGRASRAHHSDENPEQRSQCYRVRRPGKGNRGQSERQRENCMGEADEAPVVDEFGFSILDSSASLRTGFGLKGESKIEDRKSKIHNPSFSHMES